MFGRDTVADLFVDGGADAFGESFIAERRRDTAELPRFAVDELIDFFRRHACANMFCYIVEYGYIDLRAFADRRDLLLIFNDRMVGNDMALTFVVLDSFVKVGMAIFVFFTTAAPAGIISA